MTININKEKAKLESAIRMAKIGMILIFIVAILIVFVIYLKYSYFLYPVPIVALMGCSVMFIYLKNMRNKIEIIENFSCNQCHYVNQKGAIYCQQCGSKLN